MLQQTQIVTALPFYERWMERFPTVRDLAAADEQEALSLWQGLGYYRRCRMLHQAAIQVATTGFPTTRDGWLEVPGVGKYTAAAIASICFGEPSAVVDGNVERVYSRVACDPSTGSQLKSNTWLWADKQMSKGKPAYEEPSNWNQAVMELGATVCKPTQPLCSACPIFQECKAFLAGRVSEFPSPKAKPDTVKFDEQILIAIFDNEIGIQTNHDHTWWKGMSLLPLSSTFPQLSQHKEFYSIGEVKYVVTHHKITAAVRFARFTTKPEGLTWIDLDTIKKVPLPAPHRKALKLLTEFES